jgi:hypothetical protein
MNKVSSVKPLQDGMVFVEMADGRAGSFDVKPYMGSDFFRALMDENYFNQVRLFFNGIGWPDGQDIGPDTVVAMLIETECAH